MTTQAPHIIRAAVALVAELPEHMIRIVSPDLGGGFGNKVPVYPGLRRVDPGLDPARAAGEVDRGQDRQPDLHRLRPRHLPRRRDGAAQGRQDPRRPDAHRRRPRRVLLRRPAEQVQDRPDALGVRLLRHPGRAPDRARASTRTRRPAASPTGARSGSPRRCSSRSGWSQAAADDLGMDQAEFRRMQLRPRRRLPAPHAVRLPHRLRPVRASACDVGLEAIGYEDFLQRAGGGAASAAGCSASASRP